MGREETIEWTWEGVLGKAETTESSVLAKQCVFQENFQESEGTPTAISLSAE